MVESKILVEFAKINKMTSMAELEKWPETKTNSFTGGIKKLYISGYMKTTKKVLIYLERGDQFVCLNTEHLESNEKLLGY